MKLNYIFISICIIINVVDGYKYSPGQCPDVKPMMNFDIDKFIGKWYTAPKTNVNKCIQYMFTHEVNDKINVSLYIQGKFKKSLIHTEVLHPDFKLPSKMIVTNPFHLGGLANYTILDTNYDNYAVIFICQDLQFLNRQTVIILTRISILEKKFIKPIKEILHNEHLICEKCGVPTHKCTISFSRYKYRNAKENLNSINGFRNNVKFVGSQMGDDISNTFKRISKLDLFKQSTVRNNVSRKSLKRKDRFNRLNYKN